VRLPDAGPTGTVEERLDDLDRVISQLRAVEDQAGRARRDFTGSTSHPPRADALRLYAGRLRLLSRSPRAPDALAKTEATAGRALRRARGMIAKETERQELYGQLLAYQAKAVGAGRAEDLVLAELFAQACAALESNPCDLAHCRSAVLEYQTALWRMEADE
jgi:hypothetical protein